MTQAPAQAQPTIYARNQATPVDNLTSASAAHVAATSLYEIPTNAELTPRQNMLASLEARGLRAGAIARAAGMTYSEVREARQLPQYQTTVAQILAHASIESVAGTVAYRAGRIQSISERYAALQQIVEQRAMACKPEYLNPDPTFIQNELRLDPEALREQFPTLGIHYDPTNPACHMCCPDAFLVPGTETGMYIRQDRIIGAGINTRNIVEYVFDAALAIEMRKLEEQAATETGQNKSQDSVQKMYISIDMDRI